jgi:PAS domain S-box-containing protein
VITKAALVVTEPELDEKIHLLETVAGAIGEGLVVFDLQRRCIAWNRLMEEIAGVTEFEIRNLEPFAPLPLLGSPVDDAALSTALSGSNVIVTNRRYAGGDGVRRGSFDARYIPVASTVGPVLAAAVLVHDTTAARLAEQKVLETELRFKNMANASPVLLWMSDTDGLCTFFNQSWLDFTGRTLEQEWGVGWAEGVFFEDFQRTMDTYIAAFDARRVFEMEYRLRRADGQYRWILDRGSPRYAPDGQFAGYIGSCVDITDRKDREEDLHRAVQDRDDFLSIAAHELRTPLTSLQLQIESLPGIIAQAKADTGAFARAEKSVHAAKRQTKRLVRLIEELLDVSRLTMGRLELRVEPIDLRRVAIETAERFAELAGSTGTEVKILAQDPVVGSFDATRLGQIVSNLLSNALKYAAGHPVELKVWRAAGKAHLVVKDHGKGIAPEDRDRVFERFERAVSSRNYSGFGLGLWITRQLVDAHGGRIWVESEAGAGAIFHAEFDAIDRSEPPRPSSPPPG